MTGLIQWCILTPLVTAKQTSEPSRRKSSISAKKFAKDHLPSPKVNALKNGVSVEEKQGSKAKNPPMEMSAIVTKLHADLLSLIHSHSQLLGYKSVSGDDVAVVVAALLGLRNKLSKSGGGGGGGGRQQDGTGRKRDGGRMAAATGGGGGGGGVPRMEESVERLAQFLQISMSSGLLALKQGEQ